jgi:hypothetical protein
LIAREGIFATKHKFFPQMKPSYRSRKSSI